MLYVAHSPLAGAAALADLVARGADPNRTGPGEHGSVTALYGASGVVYDPEKTRLLLEAGADPNDDDSLYHAAYGPDATCLRLLLEHGARVQGTNALGAALDGEALEPVRLLLDAGADPDERAYLAHAVRRGRGPEAVALLLAHGADPDLPGGETWRGDVPLRTPYQHAVLRGRDDVAAVLADAGADTTVAPEDRAIADLVRGHRPAAALPEAFDVDQQEALIVAVLGGAVDPVVDAVGPGFRGVVGGSPEGTLLHHAAWAGRPETVRALLARGADPTAAAQGSSGTPLAWAAHGSAGTPGDHVGVAEALAAAGAEVDPELAGLAAGPLEDWLGRRPTAR